MMLKGRNKILPAFRTGILLTLGGMVFLRATVSSPYVLLMKAVDSGNIRAVQAELDKGTDPNQLPPAGDEPVSPLCAAAADGELDIVQLLLDRGARVDSGDGWDYTPLEAAATHNQIAVMELLIAHGAPVNDFGDGRSYSLWRAAVEGKREAVRFLLAHGANPNTKPHGGDDLLKAVERFHRQQAAAEL